METKITIKKEIFNEAYLDQLENYSTRHNVFYGGAGSGKSKFVVQKILLKSLRFSGRTVLVVRKVRATMYDSIFRAFLNEIQRWGILEECRINTSRLEIELPNGSLLLFKGMDDPEKIKSIENINDIVVEEASELSSNDVSELNVRLRGKSGMNQIHYMFNPVSKNNWVYKRWFAEDAYYKNGEEENTVIVHTTYLDNRFLPEDYIEALNAMKHSNPEYYAVYALGEFASLDKLVYDNYSIEFFDVNEIVKKDSNIVARFGLDFGFAADPTAFIGILHNTASKEIYIFDEFYERGMLSDEIAKMIIDKGYKDQKILADHDLRTIEEIKRYGVNGIKSAKKGGGSVVSGIQYVQQHRIFIHPTCVNTIDEIRSYSWKKGRDGEYVNEPVDKDNHLMDALRYALSDIMLPKAKFFDRRLLGI